MALTGALIADFQSFVGECRRGEVALQKFESSSEQVENSLSQMTNSFSGKKVIQDAILMAEVFDRAGGSAKFTTTELSRMGSVGGEALAKLQATGAPIPVTLQAMVDATNKAGSSAGGTAGEINTLRSSLGSFDQALSAVGLNMGREIRAFGEMADASGKTVSQLGLLATAGLALASGLAGWKIGRMVAEFFDLDEAIAKATARLLGFGDVAAETAGAKADTLARASANAGREITNMAEAVKINIAAMQAQNDQFAVSNERMANAQREVRGLTAAEIDAITQAQKLGTSAEVLGRVFGVSSDALRVLADRQKLAGQQADAHTKLLNTQRAEVEQLNIAYDKLMSDTKNANQKQIFDDVAAAMEREKSNRAQLLLMEQDAGRMEQENHVAAMQAAAAAEATYLAEQDALNGVTLAHAEAGAVAVASTAQATAGYSMLGQQVTITGDAIRAMIELSKFSAASNAILNENSLFTSRSQLERVSQLNPSAGGPGSSGAAVNITMNIVDTEANIVRRVSDAIMRNVRSGTQLGFA